MTKDYFEDKIFFWLVFLLIMLLIVIGFYSAKDNEEWEKFKAEHNCKIVSHMRGSTSTGLGIGVSGNGQPITIVTTTQSSNKTGFLCDDGVTYYR